MQSNPTPVVDQELVSELERVERINAGLVSNKATLEGELTRFKEYTRETGKKERERERERCRVEKRWTAKKSENSNWLIRGRTKGASWRRTAGVFTVVPSVLIFLQVSGYRDNPCLSCERPSCARCLISMNTASSCSPPSFVLAAIFPTAVARYQDTIKQLQKELKKLKGG